MSDGWINIITGLVATAAALLAAWVATTPPNGQPAWLGPILLFGSASAFGVAVILAMLAVRRFLRRPAKVVRIDGRAVEIMTLADAFDYFRRHTRGILSPEYFGSGERFYERYCGERLLSENKEGNLAMYGRMPHASAYRAISIQDLHSNRLSMKKAVLYEGVEGTNVRLREDVSVDYCDLQRVVKKLIRSTSR